MICHGAILDDLILRGPLWIITIISVIRFIFLVVGDYLQGKWLLGEILIIC
jgi:hypothetical protein